MSTTLITTLFALSPAIILIVWIMIETLWKIWDSVVSEDNNPPHPKKELKTSNPNSNTTSKKNQNPVLPPRGPLPSDDKRMIMGHYALKPGSISDDVIYYIQAADYYQELGCFYFAPRHHIAVQNQLKADYQKWKMEQKDSWKAFDKNLQ